MNKKISKSVAGYIPPGQKHDHITCKDIIIPIPHHLAYPQDYYPNEEELERQRIADRMPMSVTMKNTGEVVDTNVMTAKIMILHGEAYVGNYRYIDGKFVEVEKKPNRQGASS